MANARETGGPFPAMFETRRTFGTPSRDPDPLAFDGADSVTKQCVFVSFRAGATNQARFIGGL